jgi:hypothetical protein
MLTPKKPASSAPLMVQNIPFSGARGSLGSYNLYYDIVLCFEDGTGPSVVAVFVVVYCF